MQALEIIPEGAYGGSPYAAEPAKAGSGRRAFRGPHPRSFMADPGGSLSGTIRAFSGNLCWGRADPQALIDLIRRHEVDVFAAQELGPETAEAIAGELPFGALEPSATHAFQGMGVALRRPGVFSQIPLPFRPARRVRLEPAEWPELGRSLDLINVHFQAPHSLRPFPSFWLRRRQVVALEQSLDAEPGLARVVMGDFNATPTWPLYRRLARRFDDAVLECAQRDQRAVQATWGPRAEGARYLRIDHVMVDGPRIERVETIRIPGSDHSGLLCEIRDEAAGVGVGVG